MKTVEVFILMQLKALLLFALFLVIAFNMVPEMISYPTNYSLKVVYLK